jgi:hypothetical protein
MAKLTVAETMPFELVPWIAYTAELTGTAGVPLIIPVVDDKAKPLGSEGVTAHDEAAPPSTNGLCDEILTSRVNALGKAG